MRTSRRNRHLLVFLLVAVGLVGLVQPAKSAGIIRIGVVYNVGGLPDNSINDATAKAIAKAKKAFNIQPINLRESITLGSESDRELRLSTFAQNGYDLVIGVGREFSQAMSVVGLKFPATQFAIVDDATVPLLNVTSLSFSESQGAYLAGVAAGLATTSQRVGFFASSQQRNRDANVKAFVAGVASVNKKAKVLSDFTNLAPAGHIAEMAVAKVDVIYSMWSSTGEVLSEVARQNRLKRKMLLIGMKPDQFFLTNSATSQYVLGWVNKRVDTAVYETIASVFSGGSLTDILDESAGIYGKQYTVKNSGVGFEFSTSANAKQYGAALSAARKRV